VIDLSIGLLGQFKIIRDGRLISALTTTKIQILLAYLAVEAGRPQARLSLANLLWPDQPDQAALHSLRQALTTLRQAINDQQAEPPFLLVTRQTLQFNHHSTARLDVVDFVSHLTAAQKAEGQSSVVHLQQAVELYLGDFLAGLTIPDSQPLEQWLTLQREYYKQKTGEALAYLATCGEEQASYEPAILYTRRQLELNPWDESAHRRLMRCLALTGQRTAALAHYESCRHLLQAELEVEPSAETNQLVEQIRRGEWPARPVQQLLNSLVSARSGHNLPARLTSFVSRDTELAQLAQYLANPVCRLITLVGTGGVGKTRLALQAAEQGRHDFRDGVHFVSLAAVKSAEVLATAIGSALQLSFTNQESPQAQLRSYLRSKQMLLILDNFEHLLADLDLVIDLLQSAPELKLLVTSRERLNLQAEWLFQVEGLPFPPPALNQVNGKNLLPDDLQSQENSGPAVQADGDSEQGNQPPERFGAVRLFVQRAQQVKPNFSFSPATAPGIIRLCQLAEGLPLAIELAAAQMDKFSSDDVIHGFEVNLDRLVTTRRDVPARHRSLRALFDSSWERLEEADQAIFRRLAVFWGQFGPEAAGEVAVATPEALASLVDKSMLRQLTADRYDIHELLRQYAAEKLAEDPADYEATHNRCCAYYAAFLQQRERNLVWGSGAEILAEIEAKIQNIRAAWQWAIEHQKFDQVRQARPGLFRFYNLRNWLWEGAAVFRWAVTALVEEQPPVTLAEDPEISLKTDLLLNLAHFAEATDDYPTALAAAQKAVKLAIQSHHTTFNETKGYLAWGKALWRQGKHKGARTMFVQALTESHAARDPYHEAQSLYYLGDLYRHRGDHIVAQEHIQQALTIYHDQGERREEARCLEQLGLICGSGGDYSTALAHFEKALAIYQAAGDRHLEKEPLHSLGVMHQHLGLYDQARRYFEQALSIAQVFGNRHALSSTLSYLGMTYTYLNEYKTARRYCEEALAISQEIGNRYVEAYCLSYLGHILASLGDLPGAAEYYRQALYRRRKMGQPGLAIIDLAGLAWVTMAQGEREQALSQVEDLLTWFEANDTAYLAEAPQIYWTCYQVLKTAEVNDPARVIRRWGLLDAAYTALQERAERIEAESLRRSYLENVAIHRQIVAAWQMGVSENSTPKN
jgi:predicted ATPase